MEKGEQILIKSSSKKSKKTKPSRIPVLRKNNKSQRSAEESKCVCIFRNNSLKESATQRNSQNSEKTNLRKKSVKGDQTKTSVVDQFKNKNNLHSQFHLNLSSALKKYKSLLPGPTRKEYEYDSKSLLCKQVKKRRCSDSGKNLKKSASSNQTPNKLAINSTRFPQQSPFLSYNYSTPLLERESRCINPKQGQKLLSSNNMISKKTKVNSDSSNIGRNSQSSYVNRMEPCPPRFVQMAIPNKRYILANWKQFKNILSPESLTRFAEILDSCDGALEPGDISRYFKLKRHQERRKEKTLENVEFDVEQIKEIADAVLAYFQKQPLLKLNFEEIIISNGLRTWLADCKLITSKVTSRATDDVYVNAVIDICDKIATWMYKTKWFVDLTPLGSEEVLAWEELYSTEEDEETLPSATTDEVKELMQEINKNNEEVEFEDFTDNDSIYADALADIL